MLKRKKTQLIIIVLILILFAGIFIYFQKFQGGVSFLFGMTVNKSIELKKDNSINILFLGIAGGKHDGANLSDTIIFANLNPSNNSINLVSIPRDLWIPSLAAKINTPYAIGQMQEKQGIDSARKGLELILGEKVDYVLVVNFKGFEDFIDMLGGVDVEVQKTLDDYEYPIEGKENELCGHKEEDIPFLATSSAALEAFPCRYQHLHIEKGVQHMDGKTALAFARSRHAQGAEGTDFARSTRQHQVITATKSKFLSLGTLFNPIKTLGIYNVLKNNIDTDISADEIDDFIKLAQKMRSARINNDVLDMGDAKQNRYGLLANPFPSEEYKNQWVLIPRIGNGDFSEIQEYIKCVIEGKICTIAKDDIIILDPQELKKKDS
ncbi:LytR family transcriptional regulator [Candidatus Parcubacteria bacterium]|nr:MAG: LytR family transcriptional regulator [Candidatus Parcubacteria bacterium]